MDNHDINIDQLISKDSFCGFPIGQTLDLTGLDEKQYWPIGMQAGDHQAVGIEHNGLIFEISTIKGVITSFDIVLRHQRNRIVFEDANAEPFSLTGATLDGWVSFLNRRRLPWQFRSLYTDKIGQSIIVETSMSIPLSLYFDYHVDVDPSGPLSLISIGR